MRFDYCEYIDGPQGRTDTATRKLIPGKGGGGGGPKYWGLEKLYGVQSRAAQFMLDQAMPLLPETLGNSSTMVDDAMSGRLATVARNQAGADSSFALGTGLAALDRNTARYGAEFNPSRMNALGADAAIEGAANRVGAMNKASQWAEDQKWNRNAGLFAQATGTGSGAMSGMSSAGSGLSGLVSMQNQTDSANAAGAGQAGAALAYGMFKADGGYIEAPKLASGGDAWAEFKRANPVLSGNSGGRRTNPALAAVAGAAPVVIGRGLKNYGPKALEYARGQFNSATAPTAGDFAMTDAPSAGDFAVPTEDMMNIPAAGDFYVPTEAFDAAANPDLIANAAQDWGSVAALPFADGGAVHKLGLRFAAGGGVFRAMPSMARMDASSSMRLPSVTHLDDMPKRMPSAGLPVAASQPTLQIGDAFRGGQVGSEVSKSAEAANGAAKSAEAVQAGANSAEAAGKAADTTGNSVPYGSFVKAGADLLSGRNPGEAVADAALGYGGAQAGAAAGTAILPGVGTVIGGALGGLLGGSFFADGGDVPRDDYTPGGKVSGPGSETSDDIPAWLSDGEFVLNAEAVKLIGKSKLEKLNNQGLKIRNGKAERKPAPKKGKGLKLANGGKAKKGC